MFAFLNCSVWKYKVAENGNSQVTYLRIVLGYWSPNNRYQL